MHAIRIAVWNIQGIFTRKYGKRSSKILDSRFMKRLQSFDILCLQEIQCGPHDLTHLQKGYQVHSFHRKISDNKRYYGGSVIFIKNTISVGVQILNELDGDKIWIKLLKEFFGAEKDIFICFCYVPPRTSTYKRNLRYDCFQLLENEISRYKQKGYVVLAGDLNAKTGNALEYEKEAFDSDDCFYSTGFGKSSRSLHGFSLQNTTKECAKGRVNSRIKRPWQKRKVTSADTSLKHRNRHNKDKHSIDSQGRKFLSLFRKTRMRIINGRVKGDFHGGLTRFPTSLRESGSTIDYFATDVTMMGLIKSLNLLHHLQLSDHLCLALNINIHVN